ncbi:hypothetical protein Ahy_B09g096054 isoform B [Arachis hypogaea]|uniref:Uncharacterized protein n=1 Tax=Arachis hypogaea TaxID=3818 RepID=A0A444XIA8_ARAHY|nr:hypothetical protein Ahy_B09g096054 isoform B [Arachis hypogaea]
MGQIQTQINHFFVVPIIIVKRDGMGFLFGQILGRMNQLRNQNLMEIIMK